MGSNQFLKNDIFPAPDFPTVGAIDETTEDTQKCVGEEGKEKEAARQVMGTQKI